MRIFIHFCWNSHLNVYQIVLSFHTSVFHKIHYYLRIHQTNTIFGLDLLIIHADWCCIINPNMDAHRWLKILLFLNSSGVYKHNFLDANFVNLTLNIKLNSGGWVKTLLKWKRGWIKERTHKVRTKRLGKVELTRLHTLK